MSMDLEEQHEKNVLCSFQHISFLILNILPITVLMMKDGQLIYQNKWDGEMENLEAFYLDRFEGEEK